MIKITIKINQGFTIVELMIATVVFSIILLLATSGVIHIGRLYYKGLVTSRTQEVARSVTDEISKAIQLNKGNVAYLEKGNGDKVRCIGDDRYTYRLNVPAGDGRSALVFDKKEKESSCETGASIDSPTELMGNNMRLMQLEVFEGMSNTYRVDVKVAYASEQDRDLLTIYDDQGNLIENSSPSSSVFAEAQCKSGIPGNAFCAVSIMQTTVKKRLT